MAIAGKLGQYLSHFNGTRELVRETIDLPTARRTIAEGQARREELFLDMAERRIYGHPESPYRRLLLHAGIEAPDLRRMVRENGLDDALQQLYDAGVYITLDEFKARQPVRRPGLEFSVRQADFDNPANRGGVPWISSGSRGPASSAVYSNEYRKNQATYFAVMLAAHGVEDRPIVGWRPEGHTTARYYARIGHPAEMWFTQRRFGLNRQSMDNLILEIVGWLAVRSAGRKIPWPKLVERKDAAVVARWLAARKRRGPPAYVDTTVSSSVRVCLAAREHSLDIAGTVFRVGGEPLTPGRLQTLAEAGAVAINVYGTTEVSWLAYGCPEGEFDDLHLATAKVGAITRAKELPAGGTVQALFLTNLLASGPKMMLNTEIGDYGRLEERSCSCLWGELGHNTHLLGLHSYEKLTSEGVTFLGSDLYRLLEEVLPQRFGGSPIDYQFVEEEEKGLPRVSLVVAPRVGPLNDQQVIETVLETLRVVPGGTEMTDQWRQGGTLRVLRQEPYSTSTAKVLPLHVLRGAR